MMKKTEGTVCPGCGDADNLSEESCSVSENTEPNQATPDSKEKKASGFWSTFFSAILSLLLTASFLAFELLLFLFALNKNVSLPDFGPLSGDSLAMFFDSWYSVFLGGAFVLIPILILVMINTKHIRDIFLAIGCSVIAAAVLSVAVSALKTQLLNLLPGEWQDAAINAVSVFGDFCIVCAIILTVIGAACLSAYSCIVAVKGGKHEKDC